VCISVLPLPGMCTQSLGFLIGKMGKGHLCHGIVWPSPVLWDKGTLAALAYGGNVIAFTNAAL
jgi:hypothetical protein